MDSLVDYLETSARRFPERTAVVDPSGETVTYGELDRRADRIAGFLIAAGIVPGDRVGVIVPKGAAAITAFFGIMKARAAYVPADYTAPAARNRTILADCQVKAAFLAAGAEDLGSPMVVDWDQAVGHAPARAEGRDRDDLAYILYTSGSTGVPKGVMLTHGNALSFVDWCSEVFSPSEHDRFSSHAPFHFDLSILDIYVAIKHGAELHVVSEELGKSPKALAERIAEAQLTVWYSTPSILALLAEFGALHTRDYRSLRLVLFAGEVFPVKHLRAVKERWPDPVYYNLYGPTETNVCTFARIPDTVPPDRTEPYPIGWACSHCRPLVLEGEGAGAREVAEGEEGILHIAGPSVFQGYWNRPQQNATVFHERKGERWYGTGDVVRLDPQDGYVYLGRRDRMVKRRGYRIELGEIERGLYQHPAVAEAAVLALPHESGVRIVAYLSAPPGPRPSIVDLKMFCASHLPSYMSPDAFVFLDALPRTSTDKVDYQGLVRLATA